MYISISFSIQWPCGLNPKAHRKKVGWIQKIFSYIFDIKYHNETLYIHHFFCSSKEHRKYVIDKRLEAEIDLENALTWIGRK